MSILPRVLLTGATGFLGSHLLEALLNKGYEVVILKRSSSDIYRIQRFLNKVVSYNVDLQPLEMAFEEQRINVVIHTAGRYGRDGCGIAEIVESNVLFGARILDASIKYNTDTFFNTDTFLQPYLNDYALSKRHFLDWLKQHSKNIQVMNLKLEHVFGVKDDDNKFVMWFLSQLKNNSPDIRLTLGEQKRDFIYIDDVVSAFLLVIDRCKTLPKFYEFEVGTGQLTTVREFAERMAKNFQKNNINKTKLLFGAIPYRKGEVMSVNVNIENLENIGWRSRVTLNEGIKRVIAG